MGQAITKKQQADDSSIEAGSGSGHELPPAPFSVRYWLLIVSAFAQGVSLCITWPLWNVRTEVPHLPVFDFEILQIPFGWLLVFSLVLVPFRPRLGVWLHFGLMLCACLLDQMRAQPQFLATWILMLTMLRDSWKNYARWFLSSLWIWAGLHKVISPDWNGYRAFKMAEAIGLDGESWFMLVAVAVAATEIAVGLLAWWKPKWGAVGCVLLHVGISIYLSPWFRDWNFSVLPWNLATAIVGGWILWTCDWHATRRHKLAFAVLMVLPLGFFVGWLDHGYSHVLYSGSIPQGLITRSDGSLEVIDGWGETAVPFPKERRTLKRRFQVDSKEGDRLHIRDSRAALDDLHFIKRAGSIEQIDRAEFFAINSESIAGVEIDSARHIFQLSLAGVRMLKRAEGQMVYAVEIKPQHFKPELLEQLLFLPNIEQIELSRTSISDKDLKPLLDLPKLAAIGLNDTAVTDRGVQTLSESASLKQIQVEGTSVTQQTIEEFQQGR